MLFGLTGITSMLVAVETKNPTVLNETERLNPSTARGFIERGASYLRREELQKALNDFSEAVRLNPKDALGYRWRGDAYLATGNARQAIMDFDSSLRYDPTNALVYDKRGIAYVASGNPPKAIMDFDWSLRYNPTNALTYCHRGMAYMIMEMGTGKFEKAIPDLNECLRLSPRNVVALLKRGDCLSGIGQFEAAVRDYTEAIRLDPEGHFPYNNLAWLRATCPVAALRNGKEAVELATKACELTKWSFLPYIDTLAAAYAEMGEFDKAVKYQKLALSGKGAPLAADYTVASPGNKHEQMELWNSQQRLSLYEQRQPYREETKAEPKKPQPR